MTQKKKTPELTVAQKTAARLKEEYQVAEKQVIAPTIPLAKISLNGHSKGNGHKALDEFEDGILRKDNTQKQGENQRLENLRQAIGEVFSTDNLRLRTSLNSEQVLALVRCEVYAKRYNSQVMRDIIQFIIEFKVSDNQGRGRNDMVDAIKAVIVTTEVEENKSSSLRKRLLGF